MKPESHEAYIVGKWVNKNNRMVADDSCKRIEYLTRNYLKKVKSSLDGWFAIYQDPETSFYWELSYPHSELQGGGPSMLYRIDAVVANREEYYPYKKLSREELIVIVQKLLDNEGTFDDEQSHFRALKSNFMNWTDVLHDIYQSGLELAEVPLTAEQIVDKALAQRPIELPEQLPRSAEQ